MNAWERAGLAQMQRGSFDHDVQMAFERADRAADNAWFAAHWDEHHEEMDVHALASFGCFQWEGYRAWLRSREASCRESKRVLNEFQKHPAWTQVTGLPAGAPRKDDGGAGAPPRVHGPGCAGREETFSVGDQVMLLGLRADEFNAMFGTVVSGKNENGRYPVRLEGTLKHEGVAHSVGEVKAFKPENLDRIVA